MRFVCPKLEVWSELYERIDQICTNAGCLGVPPPVPASPGAWASLSNDDKEHEWALMFSWLEEHHALFLADFADAEWYVAGAQYVDEPDSSSHSPYKLDPFS